MLGQLAKGKGLKLGEIVGVGWNKESCQHCIPCIEGAHHVCTSYGMTCQATDKM